MSAPAPHFLLFSQAGRNHAEPRGQWRFVLESADGSQRFEATDRESEVSGERLDLLAVVRGLEALDQPSHVTLVTQSRYVSRGLRHGLQAWRSSGWQWERFGSMAPVKNSDLWRRVDRAMHYHKVECRTRRVALSDLEVAIRQKSFRRPKLRDRLARLTRRFLARRRD